MLKKCIVCDVFVLVSVAVLLSPSPVSQLTLYTIGVDRIPANNISISFIYFAQGSKRSVPVCFQIQSRMVTLAVVLGRPRHSSASQAALSVFVPCETRLILLCNHHGEIQTFLVFYFVTKPQLFEIQSQRIDH